MPPDSYEESLQEFLISVLYARVGEPGTLRGEGRTAHFEVKKSLGGGKCAAEAELEYALPSEHKLTYRPDILVTLPRGKRIAVTLEWSADDADPLKARAYDLLHLKQTLGERLCGVLVYLRIGTGGLSADQACEICYPFDHFFGLEHQDPQNPTIWIPVLDRIEAEMASR